MKTQTATKKYSMLLFSALAALMLIAAACQKNNGGNSNPAPVAPIYPGCTVQPCVGGVGQVPLYGGTANSMVTGIQVQFQVVGDQTGVGNGSISGQVIFQTPYLCQWGSASLSGPFTIQQMQQGTLYQDVFDAAVNLTGPQGTMSATVHIVPTRTVNAGNFTLVLNQCRDLYWMPPVIQMNF